MGRQDGERPDDGHPGVDAPALDTDVPRVDMPAGRSIREAAAIAGVTEKTIRRWIGRSRLRAVKVGGQYRIAPDDLDTARSGHVPPPPRPVQGPRPDTGQPLSRDRVDTRDTPAAPPVVDLAPLAAVLHDQHATIERQATEIRQLAEVAAAWQVRALQAEERLLQLTAGVDQQEHLDRALDRLRVDRHGVSSAAPGRDAGADVHPAAPGWLRRLWRALGGR